MYQAAGRKYGVILSADGRGRVTLYLPGEGKQAARLITDPLSLDFAYRLDDAPKWERFYFVASDAPFEVESVMVAARLMVARGSDSLNVAGHFYQSTFTFKKESK